MKKCSNNRSNLQFYNLDNQLLQPLLSTVMHRQWSNLKTHLIHIESNLSLTQDQPHRTKQLGIAEIQACVHMHLMKEKWGFIISSLHKVRNEGILTVSNLQQRSNSIIRICQHLGNDRLLKKRSFQNRISYKKQSLWTCLSVIRCVASSNYLITILRRK